MTIIQQHTLKGIPYFTNVERIFPVKDVMKLKSLFIASLIIFSTWPLVAQEYGCQISENHLLKENGLDPLELGQAFESSIRNWTSSSKKNRGVITLPVVVHVIYHTASQNIPDASIHSQMNVLNEDFRRLNLDASNTPAIFQPIAADVQIQFCLAKIDPLGSSTNGITRTYTDTTMFMDTFLGNNE